MNGSNAGLVRLVALFTRIVHSIALLCVILTFATDHGELIVSRTRTVRFGPRSFRVSAPTVWNSLPDSLKSEDTSREQFKRLLTRSPATAGIANRPLLFLEHRIPMPELFTVRRFTRVLEAGKYGCPY